MQIKYKLDFKGTVYVNGYNSCKTNVPEAKCSMSLFCLFWYTGGAKVDCEYVKHSLSCIIIY